MDRPSSGTIVSFAWSFGDGSTGSGVTASHTYASAGTYAVVLTVTDNAGATGSSTANVTAGSPPSATVHVGNLDGSPTAASGGKWNATVAVTVHTSTEGLVPNATVSGSWSTGSSGSCATSSNGVCNITLNNISRNSASVTFTVTGVTLANYTYTPGANHEVDGDSNGTAITIAKP